MPEYTDLTASAAIVNAFITKYNQLKSIYPEAVIELCDDQGHQITEVKKINSELIIDDSQGPKFRYIHPSQFDLTFTVKQ
ncbi:hypothetical protein [Enterococcus gallinarum]|uniref:hypothetical protein n=1 Tax=Enterococcus gallinarum TaxID=1353 RepID=UPI0018977FBE|nr:hypothetical protein [Enterococcus gallinarum]